MSYIFCEGPDGCGKTQIARALSDHYGLKYFKVSTERKNWIEGSFMNSIPFDILLPEFVRQTGVEFVSDRCYVSEIVYADAFGRQTDEESLWKIDREWGEMGAIIVVPLRRDYSVVDDEFVEQSKLQYLHDGYESFCALTSCNVVKIYVDDYGDDIERQLPVLTRAIDFMWQSMDAQPIEVTLFTL